MIVFEDADIEGVVDWMMTGILWGSGQVHHTPYHDTLLANKIDGHRSLTFINSITLVNILSCQVCSATSRVLVHSSIRHHHPDHHQLLINVSHLSTYPLSLQHTIITLPLKLVNTTHYLDRSVPPLLVC